jgi:hypothetical protein
VSLGSETRQKSRQLELPLESRGETQTVERSGEAPKAANESGRSGNDGEDLMSLVVERSNVEAALRRVKKNKGSPGRRWRVCTRNSGYASTNRKAR